MCRHVYSFSFSATSVRTTNHITKKVAVIIPVVPLGIIPATKRLLLNGVTRHSLYASPDGAFILTVPKQLQSLTGGSHAHTEAKAAPDFRQFAAAWIYFHIAPISFDLRGQISAASGSERVFCESHARYRSRRCPETRASACGSELE
jgi:hypothetical protein